MADVEVKIACRMDGWFLDPCTALNSACESPLGTVRGLTIREFWSMKTWKPTRRIAVLYSGDHRKHGIALNRCPFCGAPTLPSGASIGLSEESTPTKPAARVGAAEGGAAEPQGPAPPIPRRERHARASGRAR